MEIGEAVTTEYNEVSPETPGSQLMGRFRQSRDRALLVVDDGDVRGVVTRKQLIRSRHDPDAKVKRILRDDYPAIDVSDDVREVARLMVESELNLLPVYDGDQFEGVVTTQSVTRAVEPFLDAIDVNDVYTRDLRSVDPDTTLGEVINTLRTNRISRVPVIDDDGDAVGMISTYDLLSFTVRATEQQQGGDHAGFDGHGGSGSDSGYQTHGGYGERAGEEHRLLDLPARDVMNTPVSVTDPTTPLGEAVHEMLEDDYASLLVELPHEGVDGIVTLTDVLRSLTWTPDEEMRLQVFGTQYLSGMSREGLAEMVQDVTDKHEKMDVIEAYVILHKHKERLRGSPLIQATIRVFTSRGRFAGTGEEYGAGPAIRAARDRLERNVLDDKSHELAARRNENPKESEARAEAATVLDWWMEG